MDKRIRHVYKIFDKLNENKSYIGTTFDIEKRWKQHKKGSNSKKLKKDMKEFGTQDFDIEILFSGTENEAYKEEIMLIKELRPYYNNTGDIGGKLNSNIIATGEDKYNSVLKDDDIVNICVRIVKNGERVFKVLKDYPNITKSLLYEIVNGNRWKHIKNAPRRKAGEVEINSLVRGENNGYSKLEKQDIIDMCIRVVTNKESVSIVYKDYPQITKDHMYEIICGKAWSHIKEAPRRSIRKRLTKKEVLFIREEGKNGKTAKEIQKNFFNTKSIRSIKDILIGKVFSKYPGAILGIDY